MAENKKSIVKTQELQELSVYGYIRSYTYYIPDVLKDLCLLYYLTAFDEWNNELTDNSISIDNDNIICINSSMDGINGSADYRWYNAFGSLCINKGQIMCWQFKIVTDKFNDEWVNAPAQCIMFGIIDYSQQGSFKFDDHFCSKKSKSKNDAIAWYSGTTEKCINHKWTQFGKKCKINDIIKLKLDMTTFNDNKFGKLSLEINNIDQGEFCDTVDLNKTWIMAVALIDDDKIQLIKEKKEQQTTQNQEEQKEQHDER